jgi:hypothetical protein
MIFDDIERDYHGTARHREDEYSFLNRSALPPAAEVRALIEKWADAYPADERANLRARARAEFDTVFFEMFLHALLRALGCTVTVHPEVNPAKSTRPDFLARFPSGEEVVVEAICPTDQSHADSAHRARLDYLYDEIGKVRSPNFFLHLREITGLEKRHPSGRRLRAFIEEKLAELDPDQMGEFALQGGLDSMPTWIFQDGEFELEFSIWPKSPATRGKGGNPIGVYPMEHRMGGLGDTLRTAVIRKATRYGELGRAYVVAVNTLTMFGNDRIDELEALFGDEEFYGFRDTEELEMIRKANGVWHGPTGVQNRRLSAVLFARVVPWNLPQAHLRLYHNPFATHPCLRLPWRIPQAILSDSKMTWHDGTIPGELLDLPPSWPGKLFDR